MATLITRVLRYAPLALACLTLAPAGLAQTTYTVTKTADTNDGSCNADCSLREAVAAANADAAEDLIVFAPSLAGQTIAFAPGRGRLLVTEDVTIDADGLDITVDARGQDRVIRTPLDGVTEISLTGLTITGGVTSGSGGGILAHEAHLTRCVVTGNRAGGSGGGISGEYLFIEESTFSYNEAGGRGGGIHSVFDLRLNETTVSENRAVGNGGGVEFTDVAFFGDIQNTTITRNDTRGSGGGLSIRYDEATFEEFDQLIIAGNTRNGNRSASTADCASAPFDDAGGSSSVTGAGTGCGASAATVAPAEVFTRVLDPLLADTGEPVPTHALLVPGGDPGENPALALGAGAYAGAPTPAVTITLTPAGDPVMIPASGGPVTFTATLSNTTAQTLSFEAWSAAVLPSNALRLPLFGPVAVTLGPGQTVTRMLTQTVPGGAPTGAYAYLGYVGDFSERVVEDRSSFGARKAPAREAFSGDGEVAWSVVDAATDEPVVAGDRWVSAAAAGHAASTATVPTTVALHAAYPNPFTDRAMLGYDLPAAADVRLVVYDVLGREVAVVMDGRAEAGRHTAAFDGGGLPSGVYLVRLEAQGTAQTQRLTLLR